MSAFLTLPKWLVASMTDQQRAGVEDMVRWQAIGSDYREHHDVSWLDHDGVWWVIAE